MANVEDRIKKFYRRLDRYSQRVATLLFKARYGYVATLGKGARVYGGARLFPSWGGGLDDVVKLRLGRNAKIGRYTHMYAGGRIEIGENTTCGDFCHFSANGLLFIGRDVLIGPSVKIIDTDHVFSDTSRPMNRQGAATSEIRIEDDVWIGSGATVLRGVVIGRGAVIAAGAVVTRDIPENSVAAGVPARVLRTREASK